MWRAAGQAIATAALLALGGCALVGGVDGDHSLRPEPEPDPKPDVCAGALADCDGDGECETDLHVTADSCGACGEVCASGTCQAGACLLAEVPEAIITAITVDETHVYFSDHASHLIYRMPRDGYEPYELFHYGTVWPSALQTDQQHLYWSGIELPDVKPSVFRRNKDQSSDEVALLQLPAFDGAPPNPGALVVADNVALWTFRDAGGGGDLWFGLFGQPPYLVMADAPVEDATVSASGHFFWVDGLPGGALRVWRPGMSSGPLEVVDGLARAIRVVVRDQHIFWLEGGQEGTPDGRLIRGDLDSFSCVDGSCQLDRVALAGGLTTPDALSVGSEDVLWAERIYTGENAPVSGPASELWRVPRAGGEAERLWACDVPYAVSLVKAGGSHDFFVEQEFGPSDIHVRIYRRIRTAPPLAP